jgi:hypothetical protein
MTFVFCSARHGCLPFAGPAGWPPPLTMLCVPFTCSVYPAPVNLAGRGSASSGAVVPMYTVSSRKEYISEQVTPTGVRPVLGSIAENGRSVESFLPRTLTTYEMGVPFVNRLFTASASSRTEFVRVDHIRRKSCSALFGCGAQLEKVIAISAIRKMRMVWMANKSGQWRRAECVRLRAGAESRRPLDPPGWAARISLHNLHTVVALRVLSCGIKH